MTHQPEHGQDKAQAKGRGRLDAAGARVLVPRPSAVGHSVKVRGDGKRPKASRFALSRMSAFEALLSCRDAPTGSLCQLLTDAPRIIALAGYGQPKSGLALISLRIRQRDVPRNADRYDCFGEVRTNWPAV